MRCTDLLNSENDLILRNRSPSIARWTSRSGSRGSLLPDPDLSGSNGSGNADQVSVLSLVEVT